MKRHLRLYATLVLVQAACLALGLWLEHRFALAVAPSQERPGQDDSPAIADGAAEGGLREASSAAPDRVAKRETLETEVRVLAFTWITALQAAVAYLVLTRAQDQSAREKIRAAKVSLQRYGDLLRTRDAVIFGLAKLAESRDPDTGHHLERIAVYSTRLATALRRNPRYRRQLNSAFVKLIGISSALHDIGKVGIEDAILLKPGQFVEQERLVMQMHAVIGGKCIREIESQLGKSNFLQMAREIAFCHHERWDGSGYPKGLAGEEIPLAARIVAVADVYDALITKRVYKAAFSHETCVEMISAEAGKQFDPAVVEAFLVVEAEFRAIAQHCREAGEAELGAGGSSPPTAEFAAATETPADHNLSVAMTFLDAYNDLEPNHVAQEV
jgi:response regulator RpfG family c-di-GMP phosphodiesterase